MQTKIAAPQVDHLTGCERRMIRLGWLPDVLSTSEGTQILYQTFSSLSSARHQGIEPANNLMGSLAKDYVFTGRVCLQFLDPGLGGLQVSNDFNPFKIRAVYLLKNVEGGVHGDTSLQMPQIGETE